jgi:hypothetical protein
MFLGLPDPDPDLLVEVWIWTRILFSASKKNKENLDADTVL